MYNYLLARDENILVWVNRRYMTLYRDTLLEATMDQDHERILRYADKRLQRILRRQTISNTLRKVSKTTFECIQMCFQLRHGLGHIIT